ncbi:hypothetical protein MBLNU13_g09839t3 [Cladosporium sp. NU13]
MGFSVSDLELAAFHQSRGPASISDLPQGATLYDEQDEKAMQERSPFFRRFGLGAIVALNSTVVLSWQNILVVLGFVLYNGGTGGLFFSFILATAGFVFIYLSIAELSSSFPTAAGQFQWVYECAPPRVHRVLAFSSGWLCSVAWVTFAASYGVIAGNVVKDCVVLYHPESPVSGHPVVPGWFATLVAWTFLVLTYLFNTKLAKWLSWLEKVVLVVHICHAVAVVVVLWCLSSVVNARDALLTFNNGGEWPGQTSFFVGFISASSTLIGFDSSVHMTENVRDASSVVPRAMMVAFLTNAAIAFLIVIALAFTTGNVDELLASATVQPFVAIFFDSTGSKGATVAMVAPFILCLFAAMVGTVATGSRQVWSFARVGGLPFARSVSSVADHEYPDVAVAWVVLLAAVVTVVNLFSAMGFNAIISLIVVTLSLSYAITCGFKIHRRLCGPELPRDRRFSLGRAGLLIDTIALLFSLMIAVFSVFPADAHPSAMSMNWGILMFVVALVSALVYWFCKGHREFVPKARKDN